MSQAKVVSAKITRRGRTASVVAEMDNGISGLLCEFDMEFEDHSESEFVGLTSREASEKVGAKFRERPGMGDA